MALQHKSVNNTWTAKKHSNVTLGLRSWNLLKFSRWDVKSPRNTPKINISLYSLNPCHASRDYALAAEANTPDRKYKAS